MATDYWAIGLAPETTQTGPLEVKCEFDTPLKKLISFIEGRATFIGWEDDDPSQGWAVIHVTDKSVLKDLADQPFVGLDPLDEAEIQASASFTALELH